MIGGVKFAAGGVEHILRFSAAALYRYEQISDGGVSLLSSLKELEKAGDNVSFSRLVPMMQAGLGLSDAEATLVVMDELLPMEMVELITEAATQAFDTGGEKKKPAGNGKPGKGKKPTG